MELIQKRCENKGKHYFFHSIGEWFLLITYDSHFKTELRYGYSEKKLLQGLPFETTAVRTIKDICSIGKIQYATFCSGDERIVLLGIADATIIAHDKPLEVIVEENPFEHYYNEYLIQYEPDEKRVCINLPDDDITKIVMLIDEFYDATSLEYHFKTHMDISHFHNLSLIRDSINDGNIDALLANFRMFTEECDDDDEPSMEHMWAKEIIDELTPYKKD